MKTFCSFSQFPFKLDEKQKQQQNQNNKTGIITGYIKHSRKFMKSIEGEEYVGFVLYIIMSLKLIIVDGLGAR